MHEKIGKLNEIERSLLVGHLKIVVDGEPFYYKEIGKKCFKTIKEKLTNKFVKVNYEKRKSGIIEYFFDHIVYSPFFDIPRRYNHMINIEEFKKQ